jgi:hypothetical protein
MKEFEGFVRLTREEFKAKESSARIWGDSIEPYAKGDLVYYEGNIYISRVYDNMKSPVDSSWKQVFIEN